MNGYLVLDKPVGPTSQQAVQAVRRALGITGRRGTKVGHAGTLDPFASGLLLVLVGKATRLMHYVVGHDKRYRVGVRLGATSSTDDLEGEVRDTGAAPPQAASVEAAIRELSASTTQVPPQVSALHVEGERAWRRVRRGEQLDLPERPVRFHSIELLEYDAGDAGGPVVRLDVRCSAGTYMRALARDLGELVGTGGYACALRRMEVGSWDLAAAIRPEDATADDIRPMEDLVADRPHASLEAHPQVQAFARGQRVQPAAAATHGGSCRSPGDGGEVVAVLDPCGALIGLATASSDGWLQPRTVFLDPPPPNAEHS